MIEITIDGLGAAGDGVGRLPDGRVVFVEGGLPGDQLRVELTERRKKVQYAELLEVLEPSEDRIPSLCGIEACGGCALRSYSAGGQAEAKKKRVLDNLRKLGGICVDDMVKTVWQVGEGWGYRHRVRLHAAFDDGRWQVGYYARRSRKLVPFVSCPVLWPELQSAAHAMSDALGSVAADARLETVELTHSRRDGRSAARIVASGPMQLFRNNLSWFERSGLAGIEIASGGSVFRYGNLELRYDHARVYDFDLRYEPGVFTQAFPEINDRLVDYVLKAVRPTESPRVLELHAGVGNLTLPMGRAGARVVAVEGNERAAILCRRNGSAAGIELEVRACSDDEALEDLGGYDVIVLDPPRTGARAVAEAAAERGPQRVVYVSCDSATFARDAAILGQGGYGLRSLDAFDMFPQTPHTETVALFARVV